MTRRTFDSIINFSGGAMGLDEAVILNDSVEIFLAEEGITMPLWFNYV